MVTTEETTEESKQEQPAPKRPLIQSRPKAGEVGATTETTPAVPEKSITEKQQESIPATMHWGTHFTLPHSRFFIQAMEAQPDYREKNWHFVPMTINEEFRGEYGGHNTMMHVLCINDKHCLKSLNKFLSKYTNKDLLQWVNIHDETPNDIIPKTHQHDQSQSQDSHLG